MVDNEIRNVAMPRIATGIDGLMWRTVKELIVETFQDTDIEVDIYQLPENERKGVRGIMKVGASNKGPSTHGKGEKSKGNIRWNLEQDQWINTKFDMIPEEEKEHQSHYPCLLT